MQRYRQTLDEIISSLSKIEASWRDKHSEAVILAIDTIPEKETYNRDDIEHILDRDFDAGLTAVRLALDMSKDEFEIALKAILGAREIGITRYNRDRRLFISALVELGIIESIEEIANKPVSWRVILVERLKAGRGSTIKGQARGRKLENFTEEIVKRVYSDTGYDVRCRFVGASGTSTEKADFAIPSKNDPCILIEVKAYGATGSKQTDIIGDVNRIVEEKRNDTHFLLVTDGITWKTRLNDLRKLVDMQNRGLIARRIYTHRMARELESDLNQLRRDHSL